VIRVLQTDWDKVQIGHGNWREQFTAAVMVNGGHVPEDGEDEPGPFDYIMHVLTVFWKVFFALIPPTDFCGGWLCFFVALLMIGLVTMFIGDLASLLGCCMGIPDAITAITFVALGTSLPDTFASKSAAEQDRFADASIGNITGSNSVNVFLGLGMPWLLGGIYWNVSGRTPSWLARYENEANYASWGTEGGRFIVIGGDLGFSVIVFSIFAMICLCILTLRRKLFGGELGGPVLAKWATSVLFVVLWITYVALSTWKTLQNKKC